MQIDRWLNHEERRERYFLGEEMVKLKEEYRRKGYRLVTKLEIEDSEKKRESEGEKRRREEKRKEAEERTIERRRERERAVEMIREARRILREEEKEGGACSLAVNVNSIY